MNKCEGKFIVFCVILFEVISFIAVLVMFGNKVQSQTHHHRPYPSYELAVIIPGIHRRWSLLSFAMQCPNQMGWSLPSLSITIATSCSCSSAWLIN